jgi:dihydrofolate synthase/folylpolyglutamate synthase
VPINTFRRALAFLNSATDYEKMTRVGYNHTNFNLARMQRLLNYLEKPHKEFRSVHIAGTKGKGSTATMLASMIQNCNYRVGLFTSPHLVDVRERIQVDGEMISEADFTRIVARIAPIVKSKVGGKSAPTYFEILAATAFVFFAEQNVDLAVVETGLGGRLDSTNVLNPEACGITSISLDHQAQLGNTLGKIAQEKAGIFKRGIPVVSAPQKAEVKSVLKKIAAETESPIRFAGGDISFSFRFESSRASGPQTRVSINTPDSHFEHLHVPLLGEHQAINCAVALGLLDTLKQRGFEFDDKKVTDGLAGVFLPGRMELIHREPRILVDGAHNGASIDALIRAIGQNIPYDSMVVIFACQRDKDIGAMLERIQYGADKVIFTSTGSPRSADPHELAARYFEMCGKMNQIAVNLKDAVDIALKSVTREDLICVTGSFYLVGPMQRIRKKLAADS